jgi:HEAT repeat protein
MNGDLTAYLLKSLLSAEVPSTVRLEAAAQLGDRGVDAADATLRRAVATNDARAARALCQIGDAAGAPIYQQALRSNDLRQRIEAAVVLYKLQSRAPLSMNP